MRISVRVRTSARERRALLRIAPHLTRPLPIFIPTYGHGLKGREILMAGMKLYDLLTADRNRGIPDPARRIPPTYAGLAHTGAGAVSGSGPDGPHRWGGLLRRSDGQSGAPGAGVRIVCRAAGRGARESLRGHGAAARSGRSAGRDRARSPGRPLVRGARAGRAERRGWLGARSARDLASARAAAPSGLLARRLFLRAASASRTPWPWR